MNSIILYHGSNKKIEKPVFGKGKTYNDYGQGFYCTEHVELAKEWACNEGIDGFANKYEFNLNGLKILNLSSGEYTILHWLALLVDNRKFRVDTPIMRRGIKWLKEYFLIDISEYDLIIGYRADDSYFSFARAFIGNQISLNQLNYAMRLGKLGEQFVLKTEKSFGQIEFKSAELADNTIYYTRRKIRDEDARKAFFDELEKEDIDGIYMRDIIREEMKGNDARLR